MHEQSLSPENPQHPKQRQQRVLSALADYLCRHRDRLTEEWMEAVYRSPQIPSSDRLNSHQLANHMPKLFDNLAEILRHADAADIKEEIAPDAHVHGIHRWEQGYDLGELLHEVATIRSVIFFSGVSGFALEEPEFGNGAKKQAKEIIHQFFSELSIESAKRFVDEQQSRFRHINAQLKNANQSLAQANEALAEANQQLGTIDKSRLLFTRTVCHELRNILNALSGSVSVLDEETDESVRQKMILILHRNIAEMSTLLHQLLDYSVLLEGAYTHKVEPVDVKWLFEEIVAAYEPLTQAAGMNLEASCDPDLRTVVTNRLKVQQIARNLLSNALKYGKPEDKNTIGTVSFSFRSIDPQRWKITVADPGTGIPKEEHGKIFEEFYRMPSNSGKIHGTGLGLSITRTLVQVLGGSIEVHSEYGKGTRFEVILPKDRDAAATTIAAVSSSS